MSVTAIVGANWGDEGKGKMTDLLAAEADFVVRFQGGANAGHTVVNNHGKFALHLLPSGVFHPRVTNVLGPGVALDIRKFQEEREMLIARGVPEPRLFVSDRAQVVMPHHILLDRLEEERLGELSYGSTRMGIAPFYSDKSAKLGIQVADLFCPARLREQLSRIVPLKNTLLKHLYRDAEIELPYLLKELDCQAQLIEPFVKDTNEVMQEAVSSRQRVLLEGQLGALRDPDHGIYPYCSSSSPLAGFASVGAGLPPALISRVVAVVKAYSTCVGAGPFVTEIEGDQANELRLRGGEFGATTGRARRIGWFDAIATRYGARLQGATELAVTLLDVLSYLDEIPICTGYEIDGYITEAFPAPARLATARPIWRSMPGWKCDISEIRDYPALPLSTRNYIETIENLVGVPVRWVSVGPNRQATIRREQSFSGSGKDTHSELSCASSSTPTD